MANFTDGMKEAAFATSPREFDLSYSTTLEEIMEKLNARRAAFQMPFQIKGGVPGQRISFEKEPNVDVGLWLFLKDGTHIRIQPVITEAKMSVGGMRVDKNSALRKGLKGATVGLATERGGYIDTVTETVKKILNGEEVEDYLFLNVISEIGVLQINTREHILVNQGGLEFLRNHVIDVPVILIL